MKTIIFIIVIVVFLGLVVAQMPATSSETLKPFQDQVAQDFVQQYEMVKVNGTNTDRCLRAQLVAEGYLQAENEPKYAEWRAIQKTDCLAAGIAF